MSDYTCSQGINLRKVVIELRKRRVGKQNLLSSCSENLDKRSSSVLLLLIGYYAKSDQFVKGKNDKAISMAIG